MFFQFLFFLHFEVTQGQTPTMQSYSNGSKNYQFLYNAAYSSSTIHIRPGLYKFTCKGAQGGGGGYYYKVGLIVYSDSFTGGLGALVSGTIKINNTMDFYISIGSAGQNTTYGSAQKGLGGTNGGGDSSQPTQYTYAGGGGGASDIYSLDFERLMIAAGGSGASGITYGAPGGDNQGRYTTKAEPSILTDCTYASSTRTTLTTGNEQYQGGSSSGSYDYQLKLLTKFDFCSSGGGGGYH